MSNVSLIEPLTVLVSITSPNILTTSIVFISEVFEVTVKIPLDGFGEIYIKSKFSLIFISFVSITANYQDIIISLSVEV